MLLLYATFTPVSLSVDEAFRKYFPDDKDGQNDPFSSQQQQQQSIQGQSMDGYPNQQVCLMIQPKKND